MALADDTRAKIEAGQVATATALRTLADQIEHLPLRDAAEGAQLGRAALDRLRREVERILGAQTRS